MIKTTLEERINGRKPPFPPMVIDEVVFSKLFKKYKDMSYDTKKFWASSFKIWPMLIFASVFMLFFNGSLPAQIAFIVYAIASVKINLDIYTFELGLYERYLNRESYIVEYINSYLEKNTDIYVHKVCDNRI